MEAHPCMQAFRHIWGYPVINRHAICDDAIGSRHKPKPLQICLLSKLLVVRWVAGPRILFHAMVEGLFRGCRDPTSIKVVVRCQVVVRCEVVGWLGRNVYIRVGEICVFGSGNLAGLLRRYASITKCSVKTKHSIRSPSWHGHI